jgi:isopenicillin-N N-acyltransferase-like protein
VRVAGVVLWSVEALVDFTFGLDTDQRTGYPSPMLTSLLPKKHAALLTSLLTALVWSSLLAADKDAFIQNARLDATPEPAGRNPGGDGHRLLLTNGVARVPVAVVRGTPYQMGWHLGRLMRQEIQQLAPASVAGFKNELHLSDEALDLAWATTAAYTDPRVQQQLVGLAEGSGLPVRLLQHAHCLPLLMPYSCSSIAAWGAATEDGHLYQTRNLDWSLKAGAHEFPVIVVYLPDKGYAHVTPSFAGFIGAHCGMNAAGIVLSEIGDAPAKDMPYNLHAPHFTSWFRTLLYDADSLTRALDLFREVPPTKRYHFVFGDGRAEKKAVKLQMISGGGRPEPEIKVWRDNDSSDELAPRILSGIVYHDEGRGAFPTLESQRGKLNSEKLIALANQIPIKGANVMNAVFDATALRLWVSYAGGGKEAYQRPYVFLDLATLDADGDGHPDIVGVSR